LAVTVGLVESHIDPPRIVHHAGPVIKTPATTLIEHVLASIPAAFSSGRGPPDGDDVPNATGQAISEGSTV
jgi:hypothetical protein